MPNINYSIVKKRFCSILSPQRKFSYYSSSKITATRVITEKIASLRRAAFISFLRTTAAHLGRKKRRKGLHNKCYFLFVGELNDGICCIRMATLIVKRNCFALLPCRLSLFSIFMIDAGFVVWLSIGHYFAANTARKSLIRFWSAVRSSYHARYRPLSARSAKMYRQLS